MKWLHVFFGRIRAGLEKIHLVDKCIILLLTVLLLQSAYSLFTGGSHTGEDAAVDVIVRTSSAAMFGYVLSANFIRHEQNKKCCDTCETQKKEEPPKEDAASKIQIIAATTIALFCLVILLIFRDIPGIAEQANASIAATVAQLRDFISGCVGFLIGSPTSPTAKK